jgi:hypothetical protein
MALVVTISCTLGVADATAPESGDDDGAASVNLPKGKITLPAGYQHQQLQGFDSVPGRITKAGGLQIHYDIGAIPKLGAPQFGGQFRDQAKNLPKAQRKWYKEQSVAKQPVHIALDKSNRLFVAFPNSGINFSVVTKSQAEVDAALAIILTYRDVKPAEKKN